MSAVCSSRMLKWFPCNPSLSEEMERLFTPANNSYNEAMEEFRRNGHDSEYCPDVEEGLSAGALRGPGGRARRAKGPEVPPLPAPLLPVASLLPAAVALALRPGPLVTAALRSTFPFGVHVQCAFCRNNGETVEFYSGHLLKDAKGRVLCPILRAYTCPKCGASGDRAHTLKYCPWGNPEPAVLEVPAPAKGAAACVARGGSPKGSHWSGGSQGGAGGHRRRAHRTSSY